MITHGMTYRHDIVPEDRRVLPYARIALDCSMRGCFKTFALPSPTIPAEVFGQPAEALAPYELPRVGDIHHLAAREGWSRHPDTGADLCPAHRYRRPLAALPAAGTAHRQEQAVTDTAEIDIEAVKAALADEGEDDE